MKLGKKINERPYTLPNPDLLSMDDRPISFYEKQAYKDIRGASSPVPKEVPSSINALSPEGRPALTVFKGKKIMLSADLCIGAHLLDTLEYLIRHGEGDIVTKVEDCDTYVGLYRDGPDYVNASRAGKEVGNLSWLYFLITHNTWTSPERRLLHYPVPRDGLKGFQDFKISISNYTGEARTYLESLVKAAGGQFTKTMKQDNTHLITAHLISEKCDAAKEWNINIVNHLWLEESYAKCQLQSLTHSRYVHFPERTNLGEVIGQTRIDKASVAREFFPKSPTTLRTTEMNPAEKHEKPNGVVLPTKNKKKQLPDPASSPTITGALSTRTARNRQSPLAGDDVIDTTAVDLDVSDADDPAPEAPEQHQPTPSRKPSAKNNVAKTPALSRFHEGGKENETPSTTGSRGAKDRAINRLHDAAADIALYDKERKRVGGVVRGGKRVSDGDKPEGIKDVKRKRAQHDEDDEESQEEADPQKGKKSKKQKAAPISHRMMVTGYNEWVNNPHKENSDKVSRRSRFLSVENHPPFWVSDVKGKKLTK